MFNRIPKGSFMNWIFDLYKKCKKSNSNFIIVLFRFVFFKICFNKSLLLHQNVKIRGVKNISANKKIKVGIEYVGFVHKTDKTYLNIRGKLNFKGQYSIGRGCKFDIGPDAIVTIGNGGYINCFTNLIIVHRLDIGDNCAISWDCQILDDDFHEIYYSGKSNNSNSIAIGNNVWIGCGVKI